MAVTTAYTLTSGWSATNRITAAADTDVLIQNSSSAYPVFFAITENDTAPTVPPSLCPQVSPSGNQGLQLSTGERLWLSGHNTATVIA